MKEIPDLNERRLTGRLFRRLFNRRTLRGLLLGFAGLATLIALVYTEENWRGNRAWENCKRSLTDRGEVWDWAAFIPAPVPDDQNIFKAPRMSEWFGDDRGIRKAPLDHPVTNDFARRLFNADTTSEITTAAAASGYLAWSDQFEPDFALISAALKRPHSRIVSDYTQPFSITFPNLEALRSVIRTLEQRAKCHLLLGQADKAWQELNMILDLRRLVDGQGKFVTTEGDWMVRGITTHALAVIARGLELRAWQEPQLLALQGQLKTSDFMTLHANALRCGRALLMTSLETGELFRAQRTAAGDGFRARLHPEVLMVSLAPHGVWEQFFVRKAEDFQKMIDAFNPADGIVRPAEVSRASAWWKRAQEGTPAILWEQTMVNEALIACSLERYRLAHQHYPETLDALVPQYLERLPRDLVNGDPLKYHRTEDGNFQLYSVGWNETDDGGKAVSNPKIVENLKQNDWVWKARF